MLSRQSTQHWPLPTGRLLIKLLLVIIAFLPEPASTSTGSNGLKEDSNFRSLSPPSSSLAESGAAAASFNFLQSSEVLRNARVKGEPENISNNWVNGSSEGENPAKEDQQAAYAKVGCPNCGALSGSKEQTVHIKVEAIKQQILSKLHLSERPNITATVPRELVMEALRKAHLDTEEARRLFHHRVRHQRPRHRESGFQGDQIPEYVDRERQPPASAIKGESDDKDQLVDDYYGKTAEVIAFAEPGRKYFYSHFSLLASRSRENDAIDYLLLFMLRIICVNRLPPGGAG